MSKIPELDEKKNLLGRFSEIFIDRYRVTYLIIFAIIIVGVLFYNQLPRESFPDSAFNASLTFATYPGATSEDVEEIVTEPIEKALKDIDGVESIQSISNEGLSQVIVQYDIDKDPDDMLTKFRSEISKLNFPEDVSTPEIIEFTTSEIPIFRFAITGNYDLTTLKNIGEEYQEKIEAIDGVTEVDLAGGYDREVRVEFNYDKLDKYNLTIQGIKNAIATTNVNMPAGDTGLNQKNYSVRINETFESIEELKEVVVYSAKNEIVKLKDVAEVRDSYADVESYSTLYVNVKGEEKQSNPAVYLSVFREGGTDTVGLCNEIKEMIESGKGTVYPEDMTFYITQDDSVQVEEDLNTVMENAFSGLLVVIVVLFLFIGLRESMIVATVIPLALLASIILMYYWGLTFNQLSLTGFIIALGMLVDNAIVVMENVDRLRDKGLSKIEAAKVGINQIAPAILAATLTTVVAFIPLANLSGAIGELIKSIPLTIIFSLSASLLISLVITPVLSSRFLSEYKVSDREFSYNWKGYSRKYGSVLLIFILSLYAFQIDGKFGAVAWIVAIVFGGLMLFRQNYVEKHAKNLDEHHIINKYKDFLYRLIQKRWQRVLVIVVSIVVFLASLGTIPLGILELETFPEEEPSNFNVEIEVPKGYLLEDTRSVVSTVEEELFKYEGIESYNSSIGTTEDNKATITVELKEEEDRELEASEIIDRLLVQFNKIPDSNIRISEQRRQGGPPVEAPIEIALQGDNLELLEEYANKYLEVLEEIDGVRKPYSDVSPGLEQVKININKEKAANLGLSVSGIASEIRSSLKGSNLGTYKGDDDEIDIVGYVNNERIDSIKDFEKIFFTNQQGQKINFTDICEISYETGVSTINHDNLKRVVYVKAQTYEGTNTKNIMDEFNDVVEEIKLPKGIERYSGGDMEVLNDLIDDMVRSLAIALLLVFIVLALQFNSLSQPIVILISVPLAFIGVVFGLIVTNNPLGSYAMMGAVALVGIAVNDAIVLIDFANYLRDQGKNKYEAISEAVKVRFIPVIATSLTTMGGVFPLALKNPTFEQMAYVIIFGLFASTALTLFIIPNIYIINDNITLKIKKKFGVFLD